MERALYSHDSCSRSDQTAILIVDIFALRPTRLKLGGATRLGVHSRSNFALSIGTRNSLRSLMEDQQFPTFKLKPIITRSNVAPAEIRTTLRHRI